jgi:hypothetical protein
MMLSEVVDERRRCGSFLYLLLGIFGLRVGSEKQNLFFFFFLLFFGCVFFLVFLYRRVQLNI